MIADLAKTPGQSRTSPPSTPGPPSSIFTARTRTTFLLKFVMVHSFDDMRYGARILKECGVKPEIECYDVGMIANAVFLRDCRRLDDPLYFDFVLGVLGQIPATVENVTHMYHSVPSGAPWSACAVGLSEWPVITTAILLGGHVRVGFEDNIYLSRGVQAKSNAEMVEKAVRIARELDREIATPEEARAILKLPLLGTKRQ